nr:ABC transporter ATP-binding protein [Pontivivens ytuae]
MDRTRLRIQQGELRVAGRCIARALDLDVNSGEVLAILGPNGRGKTTLIRAMVGTLPLSRGRRIVRGAIGYVPQSTGVSFDYRVRDLVVMGRARNIGLFGSPGAEDYAAADAALDRMGQHALADRRVSTLSGGERQLVLIARALAGDCDVLMLDEPASALDLRNQRHLFDLLGMLAGDNGLAVVFSTHVPGHAFDAADRVLLLHGPNHCDTGPVPQALSEEALSALYDTPIRVLADSFGSGRVLRAAVATPEQA